MDAIESVVQSFSQENSGEEEDQLKEQTDGIVWDRETGTNLKHFIFLESNTGIAINLF